MYTDLLSASRRADQITKDPRYRPGPGIPNYGFVLFPDDEPLVREREVKLKTQEFRDRIVERLEALPSPEDRAVAEVENPALVILAWYSIAGTNRPYHTIKIYQIKRVGQRPGGFDGSECTFEPRKIELVQETVSGRAT
jgi:hypothetical protein